MSVRGEYQSFSGIYPHLALTNLDHTECGIGALAVWAGKLWLMTYAASGFKGDDNKLYSLDDEWQLVGSTESVGGTHANRFVHRESNQLIMGMYFIDEHGGVRALDPAMMHGRMTGIGRHLSDPANKVYLYSMEDALYEVDVHSLEWKQLMRDLNEYPELPPDKRLPGDHGKGGYTGQGRFVITHNGIGGVLAEWDGTGDPTNTDSWSLIDNNKYTDITGPGCIYGEPNTESPLWAIGWDACSVLLNLREQGKWHRFRLPKASFAYDADHGWFTEWPRIREIGEHGTLMDMHGMFYSFPQTFSLANTAGIRPLSNHLKMIVDFTEWKGKLVLAANDASMFDNPLLGRQQSNLWFSTFDELGSLNRPAGWGGVWLHSKIEAGQPSEAFLTAGFDRVALHLCHNADTEVAYSIEADLNGDGQWREYDRTIVPPRGYRHVILPRSYTANWIRLTADQDVADATAYFHLSSNAVQSVDESMIQGLAPTAGTAPYSAGVIRPMERSNLRLQFAADIVTAEGQSQAAGYYEIGGDMKLRKLEDPSAEFQLRKLSKPQVDYEVDHASVILTDLDGRRYRLPKGDASFDHSGPLGRARGIREVVTERSLMNIHGAIYELPRPESGGFAKIKPVCTHNRMIYDFCSWRGMLVLSGVIHDVADEHCIRSEDGNAALWFGNVDDLWKFGQPAGEGGPCCRSPLQAGQPTDAYLMTGYAHKSVALSHEQEREVTFTLEVDFIGDGTWHTYGTMKVPAGEKVIHSFPTGYSAHWVRVTADQACTATAWFSYLSE